MTADDHEAFVRHHIECEHAGDAMAKAINEVMRVLDVLGVWQTVDGEPEHELRRLRDAAVAWNGHQWPGLPGAQTRYVTIDLGMNPMYPPQVDPDNRDALRRWIGSNQTLACAMGTHDHCAGTVAPGSEIADMRPCLCPCHMEGGMFR